MEFLIDSKFVDFSRTGILTIEGIIPVIVRMPMFWTDFPVGRTNKWSPRRASVRKDGGCIKFEYG